MQLLELAVRCLQENWRALLRRSQGTAASAEASSAGASAYSRVTETSEFYTASAWDSSISRSIGGRGWGVYDSLALYRFPEYW
jgi:hypothetical protein